MNWGNCDYKQLQRLRDSLATLQSMDMDRFCTEVSKELAARLLALVIPRTPVGQYPKSSGKKGGTLRRGWTSKTQADAASRGGSNDAKAYMPPSSARALRPWMMSPPTCVTLLPSCWRRAPMRELRLRLALFLLRKEVQDMAVVYATLIIKGRKTIDQVPALLRKQVEEILADLEVEV